MPPRPARKPAVPDAAPVRLGRGRRPQARKLRDAREALYRNHIMEVAERIFATAGFHDARMQDIAAAAGVSLATLYQWYPGKERLHRSILIERDRQMLAQVQARWGHALGRLRGVEHVLLLMETHLRFLLDHPDYLRLQLREGYAWYARAAQPTADEQQMYERGLDNIVGVLAWGVREGLFSPGAPRDLARLILSAQQTRFANWVMDGARGAKDEVIALIQADFVRLCCRPAVAARLLSENGAGLAPAARGRIRHLDDELSRAA